ncbi:SPOR and LysM peptidoglycan-binding domain-containing protein [Psychrobacter jeotgali]|uniref:SPOR and LysM peptidoglycan-binding domain-containing protein n=1 Tax=Psychrobacter jeotgali TaxID=179010 RepID=UPI0019195986
MNFSRQALLGIGMIIGGSVMLYAMVQQIGSSDEQAQVPLIVNESTNEQASTTPLTTDIDTEKRILAQKQKERAARVAEQEKRAEQFLAEQESAEAQALAKARAENEQYRENTTTTGGDADSPEAAQETPATDSQPIANKVTSTTNSVTTKEIAETKKLVEAADAALKEAQIKKQAEAKKQAEERAAAERKKQAEEKAAAEAAKNEPPKAPTDYTVKRGDGLLKLARQYNVPVEALAQANDISPSASLQVGQDLTIPSRKQIQRLEREAAAAEKAREEKRKKEQALAKKSADAKRDAQQKLREARQEAKATDAKGDFGVQVALASNQAAADEVAKKFKAAGYEVKTSATSRGVRVIVGPERGKVAALALKDKVNSDPNVDTTSAWVLYWR